MNGFCLYLCAIFLLFLRGTQFGCSLLSGKTECHRSEKQLARQPSLGLGHWDFHHTGDFDYPEACGFLHTPGVGPAVQLLCGPWSRSTQAQHIALCVSRLTLGNKDSSRGHSVFLNKISQ